MNIAMAILKVFRPVSLQTTTGYYTETDCLSNSYNCLQSGGHGWYIVQANETAVGDSGHCFLYVSSCTGTMDLKYYPDETTEFGMIKSHEWLASFHITASPTLSPVPTTLPPSRSPSVSTAPVLDGCGTYNRKVCTGDETCQWNQGLRKCEDK